MIVCAREGDSDKAGSFHPVLSWPLTLFLSFFISLIFSLNIASLPLFSSLLTVNTSPLSLHPLISLVLFNADGAIKDHIQVTQKGHGVQSREKSRVGVESEHMVGISRSHQVKVCR